MICELAIDTAGAGCSAALKVCASTGDRIYARFADIRRGHAEHIIEQVSGLISEAGIGYHNLNGISCTMGPGSFTGVRVGIAYAKGFALSLEVPLTGAVCSYVAARKLESILAGADGRSILCEEGVFDASALDKGCQGHFVHVIEAGRDEF